MDLQLFFDNFEIIAAAPNGVKKLRELILQLAVRGKLVPQDPADEPAGKLLERISKPEKLKVFLEQAAAPYELPKQWAWARFPEIGEFGRGKSKHRPRNDPSLYHDGRYPFVQTGDVARANAYIATYTSLYNEAGLAQSKLWKKGTLCITIAANIADTAILKFDACFPDSVVGFVPYDEISNVQYFMYFMRTAKEHLLDYAPSTAQKNINLGILEELLIPLPPVEEMSRIVAKVDELMKLCDTLETQQQQNRSHLTQMQKSAIGQLLRAPDADAFGQHWQDIVENFGLLFDAVGPIGDLRSAILQLAVQGKLVSQDSADESASALLEKIKSEKSELIREGKIPKSELFSVLEQNALPFDLPSSWQWQRFGEVITHIEAGTSPQCEKRPRDSHEWGVLKISAVSWDAFNPNENKALPAHIEPNPEHEVQANDFLMSRANTGALVGKSVIVDQKPERLLINDKTLRVHFSSWVYNHFYNYYNNVGFAREYYASQGTGTSDSMKNITRSQIRNLPIPLPPLAEQKRIVAKVNQLMTLCDTLQAHLTQRQTSAIDLAEVAVRQVLDRE
jgi:type I restriction enzyme, S subunit